MNSLMHIQTACLHLVEFNVSPPLKPSHHLAVCLQYLRATSIGLFIKLNLSSALIILIFTFTQLSYLFFMFLPFWKANKISCNVKLHKLKLQFGMGFTFTHSYSDFTPNLSLDPSVKRKATVKDITLHHSSTTALPVSTCLCCAGDPSKQPLKQSSSLFIHVSSSVFKGSVCLASLN